MATNGMISWPILPAVQSVAIPKCNVPGTPTPSRNLTKSCSGVAPVEAMSDAGGGGFRVLVRTEDDRLPWDDGHIADGRSAGTVRGPPAVRRNWASS